MANEVIFNLQADTSLVSQYKLTADVIYAGIANENALARKPNPEYRDVMEAVENLFTTDEGLLQIEKVFQCYQNSKAGEQMNKLQEDIKKKLSELSPLIGEK